MKITLISDTHTKERYLIQQTDIRSSTTFIDLPGGDLLIHAGDFMSSGYSYREAEEFFEWFDNISGYTHKILIAGNHDRLMQINPGDMAERLANYKTIDYLQDDWITVGDSDPHDPNVKTAKIYGSPWQPEFYNWAFNLPRNGEELKAKWDAVPETTDILVTHGPAQTYLDTSGPPYSTPLLGCELLKERIELIKPKIHVCGHIHGGYGYLFNGDTHFFNASVLDEQYNLTNRPFTFNWDTETNKIEFL